MPREVIRENDAAYDTALWLSAESEPSEEENSSCDDDDEADEAARKEVFAELVNTQLRRDGYDAGMNVHIPTWRHHECHRRWQRSQSGRLKPSVKALMQRAIRTCWQELYHAINQT